jgi:carotenoid cleavage dioxygenase
MPTIDDDKPVDPRLAAGPMRPLNCWTRFDHARRRATSYFAGADSSVQECCFVPRSERAAEGDGYLVGVVNRWLERRNDLLVLDAQHLEEGPLAIVRLPTRIHPQIHGWWVPAAAAGSRWARPRCSLPRA